MAFDTVQSGYDERRSTNHQPTSSPSEVLQRDAQHGRMFERFLIPDFADANSPASPAYLVKARALAASGRGGGAEAALTWLDGELEGAAPTVLVLSELLGDVGELPILRRWLRRRARERGRSCREGQAGLSRNCTPSACARRSFRFFIFQLFSSSRAQAGLGRGPTYFLLGDARAAHCDFTDLVQKTRSWFPGPRPTRLRRTHRETGRKPNRQGW